MKFPGHISARRADPDDSGILELSSGQAQARLSKQIHNDKRRTVVRNNAEIKRAEGMLRRTQDKPLQKELRARIARLETENEIEQRFL